MPAADNRNQTEKCKPMTPASIGAVINSLSFRFARTMPEIPHEYVVRSPDNEAAYVALFTAIMGHGVYERWAGRRRDTIRPPGRFCPHGCDAWCSRSA